MAIIYVYLYLTGKTLRYDQRVHTSPSTILPPWPRLSGVRISSFYPLSSFNYKHNHGFIFWEFVNNIMILSTFDIKDYSLLFLSYVQNYFHIHFPSIQRWVNNSSYKFKRCILISVCSVICLLFVYILISIENLLICRMLK